MMPDSRNAFARALASGAAPRLAWIACVVAALAASRALAAPTQPAERAGQQASPAERQRLAQLVDDLGSRDWPTSNDAFLVLLREKPPAALPLVVAAIEGFGLEGQGQALNLVIAYPDDAKLPVLRAWLDSKSPLVELGAAAWLHRVGETRHLAHIAGPLRRKDAPIALRRACLQRLHGLRDEAVLALVREFLAPDAPAALVGDALWLLLYAEDGKSVALARARAADAAHPARAKLLSFLVANGAAEAGVELARLLREKPTALAEASLFLERASWLPPELAAAIGELAQADNLAVALQAIRLVGTFGEAKDLERVAELLDGKDQARARAALDALVARPDWLPKERLRGLLRGADDALFVAVCDILRRMDDESGLERLEQLAAVEGPQRTEAVRVLGEFRRDASLPVLFDALESPELFVRTNAGQAIAKVLLATRPYQRHSLDALGWTPTAEPAIRAAAVAKLRAWWNEDAQRPPKDG
ncbi:MAG: HEAT repeat domain-containing protein [Planctomycetia bacterium]